MPKQVNLGVENHKSFSSDLANKHMLTTSSVKRTVQSLNLCWQTKGDTESVLMGLRV